MCQYLKTLHIINVCELETLNGLKKHMKKIYQYYSIYEK